MSIAWTTYRPGDEFIVGALYIIAVNDNYELADFDVETDGCGYFLGQGQIYHLGQECPVVKTALVSRQGASS